MWIGSIHGNNMIIFQNGDMTPIKSIRWLNWKTVTVTIVKDQALFSTSSIVRRFSLMYSRTVTSVSNFCCFFWFIHGTPVLTMTYFWINRLVQVCNWCSLGTTWWWSRRLWKYMNPQRDYTNRGWRTWLVNTFLWGDLLVTTMAAISIGLGNRWPLVIVNTLFHDGIFSSLIKTSRETILERTLYITTMAAISNRRGNSWPMVVVNTFDHDRTTAPLIWTSRERILKVYLFVMTVVAISFGRGVSHRKEEYLTSGDSEHLWSWPFNCLVICHNRVSYILRKDISLAYGDSEHFCSWWNKFLLDQNIQRNNLGKNPVRHNHGSYIHRKREFLTYGDSEHFWSWPYNCPLNLNIQRKNLEEILDRHNRGSYILWKGVSHWKEEYLTYGDSEHLQSWTYNCFVHHNRGSYILWKKISLAYGDSEHFC